MQLDVSFCNCCIAKLGTLSCYLMFCTSAVLGCIGDAAKRFGTTVNELRFPRGIGIVSSTKMEFARRPVPAYSRTK